MAGEFNDTASQGAKSREVGALIRGTGGDQHPANVNGESFANPSPRAPTVRSESREVQRVARNRPVLADIRKVDPASLKQGDLSPLALACAGVKPVGAPPAELVQRYQEIQQAVQAIQDAYDQVPWEQLEQADPGRAVLAKMQFAEALTSWRESRQWAAEFEAEYQQALAHNANLGAAHQLLTDFPFVASKKHFADAVRWFKKETGYTDQDIAGATNDEFYAGVKMYADHMAKQGKRLPSSLREKVDGEAISAKARQLQKKAGGRPLSREQSASLVSQLLSGLD